MAALFKAERSQEVPAAMEAPGLFVQDVREWGRAS